MYHTIIALNATDRKEVRTVVNINKLKAKMVELGINAEDLSTRIGVDKATFYRRLASCGDTFSIREADLISKELRLTKDELCDIFFNQYVA